MNIRHVDLNLLVIFDALLRAESVTRAAQQLGMSQPATSLALNKLRKLFDDPLFVRTSAGISPTPHAERLAAPVAAALDHIQSQVLQQPSINAERSQRSVTLITHDIGELVFLPPITRHITSAKPAVAVEIRTIDLAASQIEPALRSGEADLALGHYPGLHSAALYQQRLFTHSFVCLVRRAHAGIGTNITRRQFMEGNHAIVNSDGSCNDVIESELRALGLQRHVVMRVQHYLGLPMILSESDLIATVPLAIGKNLTRMADIKLMRLPFKLAPRIVTQHWHSRFHRDPSNRWIRGIVSDLFVHRSRSTPTAER
ncbi:LysR family transcriptional regulator [Povalibacter sp.]|uniref:LysR family transcriptional regulator n=1 Tax=Povalibacter sp. TaxID=1962978 RepID=UPI002F3EB830